MKTKNIFKSINKLLIKSSLYAMALMPLALSSCEKDDDNENTPVTPPITPPTTIVRDTLDFSEVIREDTFFGVSGLAVTNQRGIVDTVPNIISSRIAFFPCEENKAQATITLDVTIPLPYNFSVPTIISADGECTIIADKGTYLYLAGDYSKTIGDDGTPDTSKMDKIITGETIKIASYKESNNSNFLAVENRDIESVAAGREYFYSFINNGIDYLKENASSITMKVTDADGQERIVNSASKINFDNDIELHVEAKFRVNIRTVLEPLSTWKIYDENNNPESFFSLYNPHQAL